VILAGPFMFAVGAAVGASTTTVAMLTAARCPQGAAAGSVPSAADNDHVETARTPRPLGALPRPPPK
jgi:MFS family permease